MGAGASKDMKEKVTHTLDKDGEVRMQRLEETRELFDSRAQDGKWTLEPFADLMRLGQPELTDGEVEAAFQELDADQDGKITFSEFEGKFFDHEAATKSTVQLAVGGLSESDVYVRFCQKEAEGDEAGKHKVMLEGFDANGVSLKEENNKKAAKVRYSYMRQVLLPDSSQQDFYRSVVGQYDEAVTQQMHNVMLLAYGQAGTDKAHTMFGPQAALESDTEQPEWGLFPRFIDCVLKRLKTVEDSPSLGTNAMLTLSAIEFYNALCYDLLDPTHPIVILDKASGEPLTAKLIRITKVSQLHGLIDTINTSRKMFKAASESPRSHVALILAVHQYTRKDVSSKWANVYCRTNFTLVDLAGAQGLAATKDKTKVGSKRMMQTLMSVAEANRKGETPPMTATSALIDFELAEVSKVAKQATFMWKQGIKYKPTKSMTTDFMRFMSSCTMGRARLGAVLCCSQEPHHAGETRFALTMGEGVAQLCAPLSTVPVKDIGWFEKRIVKRLGKAKEKLKKTPKAHMYYSLRVAELQSAKDQSGILLKIQTLKPAAKGEGEVQTRDPSAASTDQTNRAAT